MLYHKKKTMWQKRYISEVFGNAESKKQSYIDILLNDIELLNKKNEYLPRKLYKFYSPTMENILDIKEKKLWISHPDSFNDPFDCNIGYEHLEFEKHKILQLISEVGCVLEKDKEKGFTEEEKKRIICSTASREQHDRSYRYISSPEYFGDIITSLLYKKEQSFQEEIRKYIDDFRDKLKEKVNQIKKINVRVACFCGLDSDTEFFKKNQMWAHYADNHRGFCVEYDISSLKERVALKFKKYEYYGNEEDYLEERRVAVLKAGLFPVSYTSRRTTIPRTRLEKLYKSEGSYIDNDNYFYQLLYKTFINKSTVWSYEKEWRIIIDNNICNYYDNKIPFPYIKRIYLGCKMEKRYIELLTDISDELNIELVLMSEDGSTYNLNENYWYPYRFKKEFKKYRNPY